MSVELRLVKQHFNVKIYRLYLQYLQNNYSETDWRTVFESCGVPYSHLDSEYNWLSVEFDEKFMSTVHAIVQEPEFAFNVGCFAASRTGLGHALYAMARYALSIKALCHGSYRYAAYLNKALDFKMHRSQNGLVSVTVGPKLSELTDAEKLILVRTMPDIIANIKGYYTSLPTVKGHKSAKVSIHESDKLNFQLTIDYREAQTKGLIQKLTALFSLIAAFALGAKWINLAISYQLFVVSAAVVIFFLWKNFQLKTVIKQTEDHLIDLDENYKALIETKGSLVRKLSEAEAINLISENLIKTNTENELLQSACDNLTRCLQFDRTIILLKDEEDKFLEYRAGSSIGPLASLFSKLKLEIVLQSDDPTKVSNVFKSKKSILISDVKKHLSTLNQESKQVLTASGSTSFVCVPIASEKQTFGVILADAVKRERILNQDDLKVLETVGRHLALTLDNHRLSQSYKKFVPFEMIDLIGSKDLTEVRLDQGRELDMCVVFCDIRGFTSMSEKMKPADAIAFLNSYYGKLAPIFVKHGGIIDKFLGDGMMVLFENADSAVRAAAEYHEQLIEYNQAHRSGGERQMLAAGLGLHFGKVLLGPVGYAERMAISVVSDAVNLASRIDGLTKRFGIGSICTQELIDQCQTATDYRIIGELAVDGRASKTRLYELYGHLTSKEKALRRECSGMLLELIACELHDSSRYDRVLNELVSRYPNDPVVKFYKAQRETKSQPSGIKAA